MMQIGSISDEDEPEDLMSTDNNINWMITPVVRCQALGGQCDEDGKFLPTQCEDSTCWCVDEAGNQLPHSNTFKQGDQVCCMYPQFN